MDVCHLKFEIFSMTTIQAPWDPIQFTVTPVATDADGHLDDLDAARAGTQIVVAIDISRAGINEGGFNAYLKYVTAAAIQSASESGVALNDLDGNAITQAGWMIKTLQNNFN